jgi:hypothetical protein
MFLASIGSIEKTGATVPSVVLVTNRVLYSLTHGSATLLELSYSQLSYLTLALLPTAQLSYSSSLTHSSAILL